MTDGPPGGAGRAVGGHHRPRRGASDDWLTPPELVRALGPFDLDPCASAGQPWPTASRMLTRADDGLAAVWAGLVWLNPPYGPDVWDWLGRLAGHPGGGVALTFARTETRGFHRLVWGRADALSFLAGRLHFHRPVTGERMPANAGAPSVLAAYGREAASRIRRLAEPESPFPGRFVPLRVA